MKSNAKAVMLLGMVLLLMGLIGYALGAGLNLIFILLAVYLIALGGLLYYFNKEHSIYIMIAWTAVFLLFFDCGFSLGFGEFFLPGCLIGIVLSLYIYCRKCFSSTEKRFSYLSVGLVLISCCYFITGYLMYARFVAIVVGSIVILFNIVRRRLCPR